MTTTDWHEVVMPGDTNRQACDHLLRHYRRGDMQEDLCFGYWTPSSGMTRATSIVTEIALPRPEERTLHTTGTVSFEGRYLARVTREAVRKTQGLVFMHSHPTDGWQGMSLPDERAERDRIADVAGATGRPLVGMTLGRDGHWSARIWQGNSRRRNSTTSHKVRVVESSRLVVWQRPSPRQRVRTKQRRTIQSWGMERQRSIEAMRIGVVGLGSVGSVVAEGLARIGVCDLVLIDPDIVAEHNLDRLLNASARDIGRYKTIVAQRAARRASSTHNIRITRVQEPIQNLRAYRLARDCDVLFSCVDAPVARDVLNRIAFRDGIPVVDGGVEVRKDPRNDNMNAARWKAHVVNPYKQCLRCKGQYTSSDVMMELDGSWNNPSYIHGDNAWTGGENVFNLSLSVAAEMLNVAIRLLVADYWWPEQYGIERNLVTGRTKVDDANCWQDCTICHERWRGDGADNIPYLDATRHRRKTAIARWIETVKNWVIR